MKYSFQDISLPKWLSYRTYFPAQDNSRTYIANEQRHTFVQLDGVSSDFWYALTSGEAEYLRFLKDKSLFDAADGFLESLAEQGLILLKNQSLQINNSPRTTSAESGDEYVRFVEDMNKWLFENGFMSSLFFELTYRCNLKCVHCYNPKHMADTEIPFDALKDIIDDAYDLGCFTVTLSGGEATTYSRFVELIKYIREKHMSLQVFTNGQNLSDNETLYRQLTSVYPGKIGISLYSTDAQSHDTVTSVSGSYEKTVNVIKRLCGDGISVQIKNFLLGFTCKDCIKVAAFGKEINANVTADISLIPTIEGDRKTLKYALKEEDLFELFKNPDSPLFIGEKHYLFKVEDHINESLCFGGFSGVCVSPDLEVHVCTSLPMSLGNLKNTSLSEIWSGANSKKQDNKLYQWRSKTFGDLKDCYKESYCRFCRYCAGMAFLENGYLKKSDVLCAQAKAKEKAFNYLREHGKIKDIPSARK
ncbi:MAG: radical SAM protein [Clostridia bacterium]|nr:radical SAM protein [Clostridia bacterium]